LAVGIDEIEKVRTGANALDRALFRGVRSIACCDLASASWHSMVDTANPSSKYRRQGSPQVSATCFADVRVTRVRGFWVMRAPSDMTLCSVDLV
jgi:hypothetical protein